MVKDSKANRTKFEKETGKKAIWQKKQTSAYKKWRAGDKKAPSGRKMGDTKGGARRNFGGAKGEDWFSRDPGCPADGMTKSKAKTLANKSRDAGFAVVLDPLGGGKKMGVYRRKSKK